MDRFFNFLDTFFTLFIQLLVTFAVTASFLFFILYCFHAGGVLLDVDWSWPLAWGFWALRLMFGGIAIIEDDEED